MSQHDMVIDNAPGLAVRTDINAAIQALASSSAGTVAPTVTYAGQLWLNTSTGVLWIRNVANSGWIRLATVNAADIGFGYKTGPDRFVWNDKIDLTGRDVMVLSDTGDLSLGANLIIRETDDSIRAKISAGIGSDPGTTTYTVHDAAGAVVGTFKHSAGGLDSVAAPLRVVNTSGVARGSFMADTAGTDGTVNIRCYNADTTVDNLMTLTRTGLTISYGDFFIKDSGVTRGQFGFVSGNGTYMIYNDTAGAYGAELDLAKSGLWLRGPTGSTGALRFISPGGTQRAMLFANTENADPGLIQLYTYLTNGTRSQRLDIDASGMKLIDGASAGNVMTDGNFPSKATSAANVDFPIGSDLLFTCPAGSEMNRGQPVTMRLNTLDNFSYRHTGSGTVLSGNWINSGLNAAANIGLARRIS